MQIETQSPVIQFKEDGNNSIFENKSRGKNLSAHNEKSDKSNHPKFQYNTEGYHYSYEKINLKYTSKDGDRFELSYNNEKVNTFVANISETDQEENKLFNNLFEKLNEYILEQERHLLEILFGENTPLKASNTENKEIQTSGSSLEQNIPEYWNAENTSQRIVDFATSFSSLSNKDTGEYGEMMIEAVKKGFEEANAILGNLPDAVGELISETQRLTFEKLDAWISENTSKEYAVAA